MWIEKRRYKEAMKQKGYRMVKDYKRFRSEVEKGLHKVTITISDEALE